jgi:hypothetical protein
MVKGVHVLSIRDCGDKYIYSIQVYDPEEDDKRPLTEHNYMICPVGSNKQQYTSHGVFVANTCYDSIRYVRGEPYFHWSNSWGEIYKGCKENCPAIGCWHTRDQVGQMLKGASCWATVYAEAFTAIRTGRFFQRNKSYFILCKSFRTFSRCTFRWVHSSALFH